MMNKKIIACLIFLLVFSSAIFANGQQDGKISVMNWQFNEAGKADQLRALMSQYTAETGVEFEEISVPWGSYPDTLFTKWASNDGPDVVFLPDAIIAKAVEQDYILPLSDFVDFEQYSEILSPLQDNVKFDGKTYGFISEAVVQELIFLPELMREAGLDPKNPPTNIDEFIEYSLAIQAVNPDYMGYGTRNSMAQSFGWWSDYSSWAYGFGGRWAVDGTPTVNSEENIAALTAYKRMYDANGITKGVTSTNYRKAMSIGQCGFLTDNSSNINVFKLQNPDMEIDSAPLPFPSKDAVTELVVVGVSKDSIHKEEAANFIEWFMQPEIYIPWMEEIWCPTGAYKESVSPEWVEKNPSTKAFIDGANYAHTVVPEGLGVYMGEIRDAVLMNIEQVLINDVTPEEALNKAQKEIEKMIK